jgi:hypothetical protein
MSTLIVINIYKLAISNDSETHPKRMKQTSLVCITKNGMITKMPHAEMERVYKAKVEAVLYCREPLYPLIDPIVIVAPSNEVVHPPNYSYHPFEVCCTHQCCNYI